MTPPKSHDGYVRMPEAEFEELLVRAAEHGARRALADVALDGKEAALDMRDLRSLLECLRFVRRTAVQTTVRVDPRRLGALPNRRAWKPSRAVAGRVTR